MKSILMMICGAICVLGGIAHSALGSPKLQHELAKANVDAHLAQSVLIFWVLTGTALVVFGGILLTCGLRMRKKDYSGSAMALWVAAFLVLGNGGSMLRIGFEPHFFTFAVVGVVVVFSALPEKSAN